MRALAASKCQQFARTFPVRCATQLTTQLRYVHPAPSYICEKLGHGGGGTQPAHGSCPTVDEWAGILQKDHAMPGGESQEENRAIKNGSFDLVGSHDRWFFGPKLEAVHTALTSIPN